MKKTQIDKAIDALEGERAVLDAAIAKLRQQQQTKAVKRPRAVAAKAMDVPLPPPAQPQSKM